MKKIIPNMKEFIGLPGVLILALVTGISWLAVGCSIGKQAGEVAAGATAPSGEKSGAELWAENCVRCHNIRSPSSYSPAQWEVVMMHMRVRANLTPAEHKKILEFLKAGS